MDFISETHKKSSDDESVEDLLMDLESAIKKKATYIDKEEEKCYFLADFLDKH